MGTPKIIVSNDNNVRYVRLRNLVLFYVWKDASPGSLKSLL